MDIEDELAQFEQGLRDKHNLDEASIDFFVRRKRARLEQAARDKENT